MKNHVENRSRAGQIGSQKAARRGLGFSSDLYFAVTAASVMNPIPSPE